MQEPLGNDKATNAVRVLRGSSKAGPVNASMQASAAFFSYSCAIEIINPYAQVTIPQAEVLRTILMTGYKEPGFADRVAAATAARAKALARLQAKPAIAPEVLAERAAKAAQRDAAQAEKRAAALAQREAKRAAQLASKQERLAADQSAAAKPELTEAERKAARDARYAARKARKK